MSLKSLLMPAIMERMLAADRLAGARARAERTRVARGLPHQVHYFHQTDDPFSALAAQALPGLAARYDIELVPHLVGPPADAAAPAREMLVVHSRRDAALLARRYQLRFADPGAQPSRDAVLATNMVLRDAIAQRTFVALAGRASEDLWCGAVASDRGSAHAPGAAESPDLARHLRESEALRKKLGHYLGATFYYAGEWYWGIDRLHYLETRLQELGAQHPASGAVLFAPPADLSIATALKDPPSIDFFLSLRSPYSAIVAPRVFALADSTGARVRLRFVLPMVMRGLPVPREKRIYIVRDVAREAHLHGIPFGRLNDPVGRPTERGLSLIPFAEQAGLGRAYVLSFMHGVWAEGLDAGSERGLRRIVERAGLAWSDAALALRDQAWRATAEANRSDMFALGLWGVPSFAVGDTAVWGQDRLWAVEEALRAAAPERRP